MLARNLTRLIASQVRWARPFGDFNHRWLKGLFGRTRPLKDFLNGTWLGHPLHAALTDVPVGSLTLVLLFDLLDLRTAADVSLGIGILSMVAAAVAGLADFTDTDEHPRMVATVHGTLMVLALLALVASLLMRLGGGPDRSVPVALDVVGYLLVLAGAYVGGEIAYALGNMVNRHAWRFSGTPRWQPLDVTEIPEGEPVSAQVGGETLVLVRQGEMVHALHERCAHAGGPLSGGTIVDGCIQCPWHQSRFELGTGARRSGPTTYDQPRYQVRKAETGGYEALRVTSGSGRPEGSSGTSS